jgi:hypothetical protein
MSQMDAAKPPRRPGRPRLEAPTSHIKLTLSLRPGEDDDLQAWFDRLPPRERAARVKAALRQGGVSHAPIIADEAGDLLDDAAFAALLDGV